MKKIKKTRNARPTNFSAYGWRVIMTLSLFMCIEYNFLWMLG